MKNILLCLVLALTTVSSFAMEKVQLIENGEAPQGKAKTLKFTEELRLTADQGDDYIWVGPTCQVVPDYKGNLYVLDTREKRVLAFDANGKFVRVVGKQGPGPGEFQVPQSLQIFPDGTGIVQELVGPTVTVNHFDESMNYKDRKQTTSMTGLLQGVVYAPSKKVMWANKINVDMAQGKMLTDTGLLDADAKALIKVAHYEMMAMNPGRVTDPEFWVEFMSEQFRIGLHGLAGMGAFDQEGNLYTAINGKYHITKYDTNQQKTMEISRKYKPVAYTEEQVMALAEPVYEMLVGNLPPQLAQIITPNVLERAIKKAEPPSVKPPVNGMKVMEDGTLLVLFDSDLKTGKEKVDIFSKQGQYLGQVTLNNLAFGRMVFRNGKAYTMETVDGENELVRFSVSLVNAK